MRALNESSESNLESTFKKFVIFLFYHHNIIEYMKRVKEMLHSDLHFVMRRVVVLTIMLVVQCRNVVDGFGVAFGLGAIFFQPKLITKPSRGDINSLLEASNFFVESFWVGKVGGGATE